jgi:transposase-like protein
LGEVARVSARRCTQKNVDGSDCRSFAMAGSDRCATHLRRSGQSPKLTPEVKDQIVQLLRTGNYVKTAAAAAGVSERSYRNWMQLGDPEGTAPERAIYRAFREEVEVAIAEGEAVMVRVVMSEAANRNWQAAAWFLERAHPKHWARPSQREGASSEADKAAEADFDEFREEDELAAARRARIGGA